MLRGHCLIPILIGAALGFSQENPPLQPGTLPSQQPDEAQRAVPNAPKTGPDAPLTVGGKFRYRMGHSFAPFEFLRTALGAGFDQWRNKGRMIDAVKYTFVVRNDNGGVMPSYSRFVGAYGAAFLSRLWYPYGFQHLRNGLSAGTTTLAIDAGMNVVREFFHFGK